MSLSSLSRWLDARLIAPDAGTDERLAGYIGALAGTASAVAMAVAAGLPAAAAVVVGLVAFDLFGGAVVNATGAARRRFRGPARTVRHHLGFVAVHVQPFVLALFVPGFGWGAATVLYALALGGATAVLLSPARMRRPVAFAGTVLGLTLASALPGVPDALAWVAPVLLIKLLLSYLPDGEAHR